MAFTKYSPFYCRFLNAYSIIRPSYVAEIYNVNHKLLNYRLLHGEVNPKVESKLKTKDSVSDKFHIIYRAPYVNYCKFCYGLTTISSTVIPSLFSTMLFTQGYYNFPFVMGGIEIVKSGTEVLIYSVGLLIAIAQVGIVIFRYPYRIYRSSCGDEYIMIYQHILPWKNAKEELRVGELKKTEKSLMPWKDALYEFRNRKAILLADFFHRPIDLELMLKKDTTKVKF